MKSRDDSESFIISPTGGHAQQEKAKIWTEKTFEVGKKMELLQPDQPYDHQKYDIEPSSEFQIPDLNVRKSQNGNDSTDNRCLASKVRVKESVNTLKGTLKNTQNFINRIKQFSKNDIKSHKLINNRFFSPLNFGKPIPKKFQSSLMIQLWKVFKFVIYCCNLIIAPILYMIRENRWSSYIYIIMVFVITINILLTFNKLIVQRKYNQIDPKFNMYYECFKIHILDILTLSLFSLMLMFQYNVIKIIGLLALEYNSFTNAVSSFNNRIKYEFNDLTILFIKIASTCHLFSCIETYYTVDEPSYKEPIDFFFDYWRILNHFLHQTSFDPSEDFEQQSFELLTHILQLYYLLSFLKLFILSSLHQIPQYQKLQQMKNLQKFIYRQEISTSLKEKVSKKVVETFERDNKQKNCFEDLQNCLRKEQILEEFKKQTLTHFVNQYEILSQFSVSTRQQIVSCLCSVSLNPNDTINLGSQNEGASMYLIKSGKVSIHSTEQTQSFYNVNQSESFGEYSFFTGQESRFLAKSLDYTILYKLKRDQFLKIISANPTDIEIAAHIRDQVLFNSNFSFIRKKCHYCNSTQHLVFTCPLIHFSKERTGFYDRYLYPHSQQRQFVTRRIMIRKHTFLFLNRKNPITMKSCESSSSSLTSSEIPSFTESLLMSSVFNQNLEIQSNQRKGNLKETLPVIPEDINSSDIIQNSQAEAQNPKIIRLPSYKIEEDKQQLNNFRLNEPGAIIQQLMKKRKESQEQLSSKSPQKSPKVYSSSFLPAAQNIENNSPNQFTMPTQSEMLLFASLVISPYKLAINRTYVYNRFGQRIGFRYLLS